MKSNDKIVFVFIIRNGNFRVHHISNAVQKTIAFGGNLRKQSLQFFNLSLYCLQLSNLFGTIFLGLLFGSDFLFLNPILLLVKLVLLFC